MLIETLAEGTCADYAGYRNMVGQLQGLSDAIKLSREADFNLSGDEPDVSA